MVTTRELAGNETRHVEGGFPDTHDRRGGKTARGVKSRIVEAGNDGCVDLTGLLHFGDQRRG